jgi:hypothetical protein
VQEPRSLLEELESRWSSFSTRSLVDVVSKLKISWCVADKNLLFYLDHCFVRNFELLGADGGSQSTPNSVQRVAVVLRSELDESAEPFERELVVPNVVVELGVLVNVVNDGFLVSVSGNQELEHLRRRSHRSSLSLEFRIGKQVGEFLEELGLRSQLLDNFVFLSIVLVSCVADFLSDFLQVINHLGVLLQEVGFGSHDRCSIENGDRATDHVLFNCFQTQNQ